MLRKSVKITVRVISVISILLMASIVSFFVWISLEPRSLSSITPYIESKLSAVSPKLQVKIDSSYIELDKKQRAISVHVKNVAFLNETNDEIAALPEISFGFSLIRFLKGQIFSPDLTLFGLSLRIDTSSKTLYVVPESEEKIEGVAFKSVYEALKSNNIFNINSIRLNDASIFISTSSQDMVWKINEAYAKIENQYGKNNIKSEFRVNFGKDAAYFMINLISTTEKYIDAKIKFNNLPSYTLNDLFPEYGVSQYVDMVFSGESRVSLAENGSLSEFQVILEDTHGKAVFPEVFKYPLEIKDLALDVGLYPDLSGVVINNFEIDMHGPKLQLSGNIKNTKSWPEILPDISINASASNIEMADVDNYWPVPMGELVRKWLISHITDAVVKHAEAKFNISAEDIKKIIDRHKLNNKTAVAPMDEKAITATLKVAGATVDYLPDQLPKLKDCNALVKFTGHSMDATISSARFSETKIKDAHVKFTNLWHHPPEINITGNLNGNAKDIVPFLKLAHIDKKHHQEIEKLYGIKGDMEGNVFLAMPLHKQLSYDDITLKIISNLKNLNLPGFINDKDISNGEVEVKLEKYDLSVDGKVDISNIPIQITLHKNLSPDNKEGAKIKASGDFLPEELQEISGIDLPFVTGKMGMDIDMALQDKAINISGKTDLAKSDITIPDINFNKAEGVAANAIFNIFTDGKKIKINNIELDSKDIDIKGSAELDATSHKVSILNLTKAKFDRSDFAVQYNSANNATRIKISGNSLDISGAKFKELMHSDQDAKKQFDLDAKLQNLYMQNGEVIKEFEALMVCNKDMCTSGNLYGKISKDNFIVGSLKNIGDRYALLVESDNAGAVVNALNISKNIRGGRLNIDASLGKRDGGTVAQGIIKITDFTAVKTPLLGKLLTLASLRGIFDLLENEGIRFKKFEAPVTLYKGVITVTEGKSSGASVGITADGTIDTNKDEVDLKGVIVPAYAVNNLLGKIPLIGKLVTGGENEGIIATRYSIKGPYDNAKASVNPLSILTPGFLRNLFDVFD